jgi:Glycosyltransferase
VLEALSLGLPVICHDACGMGIAVTKKCGIKIPLCDPQTSIEGFSQAIRRIFDDKALVESLSRGALERAAELSWDKKVEEIVAGYEDVVINRQEGK